MREQLILGKEDVHVVELTVKSRETLPLMLKFCFALDKVPLEALLGHLVLVVEGTYHLLVVKSTHSLAFGYDYNLDASY